MSAPAHTRSTWTKNRSVTRGVAVVALAAQLLVASASASLATVRDGEPTSVAGTIEPVDLPQSPLRLAPVDVANWWKGKLHRELSIAAVARIEDVPTRVWTAARIRDQRLLRTEADRAARGHQQTSRASFDTIEDERPAAPAASPEPAVETAAEPAVVEAPPATPPAPPKQAADTVLAGVEAAATKIRDCESGARLPDGTAVPGSADYTAQNPTSSASGAYQFIDGTWEWVTGLPAPARAHPPAVQDAAFAELYDGGRGAHHWDPSRSCWG